MKNETIEGMTSFEVRKNLAGHLTAFLEGRIRFVIGSPVDTEITETETPNGRPIRIICMYNIHCIRYNIRENSTKYIISIFIFRCY